MRRNKVRTSCFPVSLMGNYLAAFLLMSGIHMGIIVLMDRLHLHLVLQSVIPIIYWLSVSIGMTVFTRSKMKQVYEMPVNSKNTVPARQLEDSKKSAAAAIAAGIVGTAFMAGSVFAVTADTPMILLCIVLAVPGFIGWALPWFLYKRMVRRRTEKIAPLIEAKYDEAYAVCEKGCRLLQQ